MKIKLVRYPYKEYEIGEVVDLGEVKNSSMVSLGRAVWVDEGETKPKKNTKVSSTKKTGEPKETKETDEPKKLLRNKLWEKVQKKKQELESDEEQEEQKDEEDTGPARGPDGKFVSKKDENS